MREDLGRPGENGKKRHTWHASTFQNTAVQQGDVLNPFLTEPVGLSICSSTRDLRTYQARYFWGLKVTSTTTQIIRRNEGDRLTTKKRCGDPRGYSHHLSPTAVCPRYSPLCLAPSSPSPRVVLLPVQHPCRLYSSCNRQVCCRGGGGGTAE